MDICRGRMQYIYCTSTCIAKCCTRCIYIYMAFLACSFSSSLPLLSVLPPHTARPSRPTGYSYFSPCVRLCMCFIYSARRTHNMYIHSKNYNKCQVPMLSAVAVSPLRSSLAGPVGMNTIQCMHIIVII